MSSLAFFHSCGGRDPIRFRIGAEELAFESPVILVGTSPRADVVLPPGNHERALAFVLFEGRLFALPLAETASLRNDELCRPGWVEGGDVFHFNGLSIEPLNPWQGQSPRPEYDPFSSNGQRASNLHFEPGPAFQSKKSPARLAVLPRITMVGRSEPSKFKINYEGVDPQHALLLRTSAGPWLADLTLKNRTLVNDGAVSAARLRHGDRVSFGSVELVAHVAGEESRSDAVIVATAPPVDAALGPILQQVAQFQQQTFEQFREMLGSVTEMFGSVMHEHRQFVREEFARLERMAPGSSPPVTPAAPQLPAAPPPSPKPFVPATTVTPIPPPAPGYSAPPPNVELHTWLHEQLGSLEKQQSSRWKRLVEKIRKKKLPE